MSQSEHFNPRCETLPREDLEQLQIERLQSTLNRAYRNVVFYRTAFDAHKVNLEKLRNLRALPELPFTTREDLGKAYPYDMFAVPLRDIVRIHSVPGAAEKKTVVGYTRNDLRGWTECCARLLFAAGIRDQDVVQIALDYNLYAGGFGFLHGAEGIGASVIPSSSATGPEKQVALLRDFKTTALVTTPGYAAHIAASLEEMGVHPERLQLRLGLFGGERWTDAHRRRLEERLHISTIDSYGLSDMLGPGVAGECTARRGLHINEDHFIAEVIDPRTLEPLPPGREGELVFTTITKEGFPLIRYRTGDVSSIDPRPCACGRTSARMARVLGRTDDLIRFRGVGFFPSQIEAILMDREAASPHFQVVLDRDGGDDTLEVKVEVSEKIPSLDELKTLESLRQSIVRSMKIVLDLEGKVTFVEPKSLRSAPRVVDRRGE